MSFYDDEPRDERYERESDWDSDQGPSELFDGAWGHSTPQETSSDADADADMRSWLDPRADGRADGRTGARGRHPAYGPGRTAKLPMPDMDRPPAGYDRAPGTELRDRFARVGPASDAFPVIVCVSIIVLTFLATGFGPIGKLSALLLVLSVWTLCVRIHIPHGRRFVLYAMEATALGTLIYFS